MVSLQLLSICSAFTILAVSAIPQKPSPVANTPVSILTPDQVRSFDPYTHYAAAVACGATKALTWTCGAHCQANPSFKPVASGGDGSAIQFWFVGYDPTLETVIVTFQGADPSKIISLVTGSLIFMSPLNPSLFPGISGAITVHHGFGLAQKRSSAEVLEAVKTSLAKFGTKKVTIVGHSLGGAIALISSIYLPLHLPTDIVFRTVTYGVPRAGNKAFADYLDTHANITHINNRYDAAPAFPGRILGYVQPKGEIHIVNSGDWVNCPGQENTNAQCLDGYTPNVAFGLIEELLAHANQHIGPYGDIFMSGCS